MSTKWLLGLAVVVAALSRHQVDACGPGFPTNMIVRRADALATMWDGSFTDEAKKLAAVSDADRAAFTAVPTKLDATKRELDLYRDAAAQFHAGDYTLAAKGFEALLRLPAAQRKATSVSAAYSLGRARAELYDADRAIAAFRHVRVLVRAGFVDGDGLARASLGEEARIERTQRGNMVAAVHRYAEQAALGDSTGWTSLLFLMQVVTPKARAELYRDDVGTKLLALYYYTRTTWLSDEERPFWKKELLRNATTEARGAGYMAAAMYREGAWDTAATLASRCVHSPIATWVQAKLALRDGDRTKAEALLRVVERAGLVGNDGTGDQPYTLDGDPRSLVRADLALLALSDGRFVEAARWFARGNRTAEAAYVADRVLTFDELEAEVQRTESARVAGPKLAEADDPEWPCANEGIYADGTLLPDPSYCWSTRLQKLYARRAMREHRFQVALDAVDNEQARALVSTLDRADTSSGIERAEQLFAASRILRAHGLELAGTETGPDWAMYDGQYARPLLCLPQRAHGYTRFAVPTDDDYGDDYQGEDCLAPSRDDAALVSPLEVSRVRASAPEIDERFSYRYTASRLAEQAAELVPPRSQAYAAALCWAARFAHRDQTRVEELYAKYNRNGAAGALTGLFAEDCDEPDFHAARDFDERQAERRMQRAVTEARSHAWTWPRIRRAAWRRRRWVLVPLAFLVALLALLVSRRRLPRET
ncbi:MAG TPA: hypothetical protein VMZ53_00495 [Kofleriaceae bacterium]|nr:hypothetical protein [Kofleriaceae bacterium]